MRNVVFSTESWRTVYQNLRRRLSNSKTFQITVGLSLLIGMMLTLASYLSLVTTAQEQKPTLISPAASLDEARAGQIKEPGTIIPTASALNFPEGGSCG